MSEQGRVRKPQEDSTEKEKPGPESRHPRKGEAHAQRLEDGKGVEGMRMGRSQPGSEGGLTATQGKGEGKQAPPARTLKTKQTDQQDEFAQADASKQCLCDPNVV